MVRSGGTWIALLALCSALPPPVASAQQPPAHELVDLHVDLPFALHAKGKSLSDSRLEANLSRLRRGHVGWLVLPLYVPDGWDRPRDQVAREYEATYSTLMRAIRTQAAPLLLEPGAPPTPGRIRTTIAFEGADGLAGDTAAVARWADRGACVVGLVHSHTNALSGASMDPSPARRAVGLTPAGKDLARAVYQAGALVDLAHMSDAAMSDTAAIAASFGAPLIDTHTGVRALRPIARNIDDDHLRAIGLSGGVVGIDLHSGHVAAAPGEPATLDDVVQHIEHAARVAGPDHVAIGSDLEGQIEQPSDADGAATWPALAWKLRRGGWSEDRIAALFHGNADRVLRWTATHGCGVAVQRGIR
jgi:membrane dipeptidase